MVSEAGGKVVHIQWYYRPHKFNFLLKCISFVLEIFNIANSISEERFGRKWISHVIKLEIAFLKLHIEPK